MLANIRQMMFRAAKGKVAESRPFDDGFVFPSLSYCFCRCCCDCFCFFRCCCCCCCCCCFCCRCSSSRRGDRKDDRVCCRRASWQRRLGAREEMTITIESSRKMRGEAKARRHGRSVCAITATSSLCAMEDRFAITAFSLSAHNLPSKGEKSI